jgi:type I restriction enzyme S subunit
MAVMAGYKQTEVGVIPEDWTIHSVQDLIDNDSIIGHLDGNHGELYPRSDEFKNLGVPYITANDFGNHHVNFQSCKFLSEMRAKRFRKGIAINGDVLFAHNATVGPVALLETNLKYVILSTTATYFRCNPEKLSNTFVLYLLQSPLFVRQYQAVMSQSTRNQVPITAQRKLTVALPPTKAEQEAIAGALSDVDALIESLEQLIAKKRHLKQGTMQELLTGKKRLPGFSGEWEVKQLGDVIEKFVGGGTPSRSNPQYWGSEIPWVTVKDFATFDPRSAQEAITKTGLQNSASHLIPQGILITSTRMALGKAVVYEVGVAINQDLKALFPKPELSTQYLYFWFQYHGQSIDELGSGSTVKGISLPDLKKIEFSLPLIPEQTAIATILSDMDTEIAALETRLAKTRSLKQGMMHNLLTGKVRLV